MSNAVSAFRRIIVIAGPTASGKSDVAMQLSERLPIEIVCADARTIYRGLDIGTAKPSHEDQTRVKHHCLDIVGPEQSFTASMFSQAARLAIDSITQDVIPVVVGGSGFYIKALLDGLSEGVADVDEQIRQALTEEYELKGRDAMYDELVLCDPKAAALYADKNPRRVQRALEYFRATGDQLSSTWDRARKGSEYDVLYVAIHRERDDLRDRIARRCHRMWELGLLRETEALLSSGIHEQVQSLQTVGYKQAIDVLRSRREPEDAGQEMVHATWQYAKRQLTWFRKDQRYTWIDGASDRCADDILRMHEERKNIDRV